MPVIHRHKQRPGPLRRQQRAFRTSARSTFISAARTRTAVVVAGVILFTVAVALILKADNPNSSDNAAIDTAAIQVSDSSLPSKKDTTAMRSKITEIINANPDLTIGVTCIDLVHGTATDFGDQSAYVAASVAKLLTASLYLHNVQQGQASLDTLIGDKSAGEQIRTLVVDSDQPAWDLLRDYLGRDNIEAYAHTHGLQTYRVADNTVTPREIAAFLQKLHNGSLLNEKYTAHLLSHMQQAGERQYIVNAIPPQATAYHKAGYLADRVHDAAIIDDGAYPYVLVIFTKTAGDYDYIRGAQLFSDITAATTATFIQ